MFGARGNILKGAPLGIGEKLTLRHANPRKEWQLPTISVMNHGLESDCVRAGAPRRRGSGVLLRPPHFGQT